MNDLISRQDFDKCLENAEKEAIKNRKYVFVSALNTIRGNLRNFPSAQPEQSESEDITFWKKRAREYEEMVLKLTDEMARGIKINSVLITEEGIVFKKEKPEQRWITSGKPMNGGMYLVTLRQKFEGEEAYGVRIMRFINGNWVLPKHFPEWINEEIEQEVLAWRELPEPWKER